VGAVEVGGVIGEVEHLQWGKMCPLQSRLHRSLMLYGFMFGIIVLNEIR